MEATVNERGTALVIKATNFSTRDYDTNTKYKREVQRKSVSIDITPEAVSVFEGFGMPVYTVQTGDNTGQNFTIAPFSATTKVYNKTSLTQYSQEMDSNQPNVHVKNGDLVITKSHNAQFNKDFFRVSVIRFENDNVEVFQSDYFGDNDSFHIVEDVRPLIEE